MSETIFAQRKLDEAPPGRWCSSGHVAPTHFVNTGRKLSFFETEAGGVVRIVCEACLILAYAQKRAMKGRKR